MRVRQPESQAISTVAEVGAPSEPSGTTSRRRFARWSRQKRSRSVHAKGGRLLHPSALFPLLIVLLAATVVLNVGIGGVPIGPAQVVAILLDRVHLGAITEGLDWLFAHAGWPDATSYAERQANVLWMIRLPRVVLAGIVGAGLAISGAALQGIFRNPLADPGLIGVSSGASVGAIAAIVLGISSLGRATLPITAFAAGLATTLLIYLLARHNGRTEIVTLLLTGVALNAIAGAATGYMTFLADDQELRDITFWSLGSVGGATWPTVGVVAPFVAAGVLLIPRYARQLNLLVLGEREARHLGVATERVRLAVIVLTALMTGAAVSVAGTIGFVGLVVPHVVRLVSGPDHRVLLPASAIAGAILLMLADLFARTAVSPAELPLGVVTALAGGPFFLWLIYRTRRAQGGWG